MLAYLIRLILYLIPVLFVLTLVVFTFVQLLPGDIIDTMIGEEDVEDPEVRCLEKEFGLDQRFTSNTANGLGKPSSSS